MVALAARRAACRRRAGPGRARHRLRRSGQRDDAAAPVRAGARARRAQRLAARIARFGSWPRGGARDAGQICVRLGDLRRAEEALHRALDVRSPIQFHETTGAVFDTLRRRFHLIRRYDTASDFLQRHEAFGAYGRQSESMTSSVGCSAPASPCGVRRWTMPSRASTRRPARRSTPCRRTLHRRRGTDRRQPPAGSRTAPRHGGRRARSDTRGIEAESLRLREVAHAKSTAAPTRTATIPRARRCWTCSASATSRRSVTSRWAGSSPRPARSVAERHLNKALEIFEQLGAERDIDDTAAECAIAPRGCSAPAVLISSRCRR